MKSKDLYVKFNVSMSLISDFLEENLATIYKVRTFTEDDKNRVTDKLAEIIRKNKVAYQGTWDQIEKDLETLKKEIIERIDMSKQILKERHSRSQESNECFYQELKEKVRDSKTRDLGDEMDGLKDSVRSEEIDALEVVGDIGNKVNVDIRQIEGLNKEFQKMSDFVDYIHGQYQVVREQTIPTYNSMDKTMGGLIDKIDHLTHPATKVILEESKLELSTLLTYYESLIKSGKQPSDRMKLMSDYIKKHKVSNDMTPNKGTRGALEKKASYGGAEIDRRGGYPMPERQVDLPTGSSTRDKSYKSSNVVASISNVVKSTTVLGPGGSSGVDFNEASNEDIIPSKQSLFDGSLCPQYIDTDLTHIKKTGSLSMCQFDSKDFIPVIHLYNNCFLVSTFQKKEGLNQPVYGFKISFVPENETPEVGDVMHLFSSESLFLTHSKINHLTVLERESDGLTLVTINTEDSALYFFNFVITENQECIVELENSVQKPKGAGWLITSMKKLGRSDFLICTNTKGEIMVYDTVKGEIVSTEKRRVCLRGRL